MSIKAESIVREHEALKKEAERRGISYEELLVEDNIRLAYHIAHKYKSNIVPLDEAVSASLEGLWKAAISYDPRKGVKFSHYAATCMQRAIFLVYRRDKKHAEVASLNALADKSREQSSELQDFAVSSVFDAPGDDSRFEELSDLKADLQWALSKLPEAYRKFLELRYTVQMTTKQISAAMGKGDSTLRGYRQQAFQRLRSMLS